MNTAPRMQLDIETAWASYLSDALPNVDLGSAEAVVKVSSLLDIADRYDVMLLDGFGVLNCGDSAVPGMPEMFKLLRERGTRLLILSNGATAQMPDVVKKYRDLGYPVDANDVLTSRDATRVGLACHAKENPDWVWGVTPVGTRLLDDLPGKFDTLQLGDNWGKYDGFLLVTTLHWTASLNADLVCALKQRGRPVWVANPDVTAPFVGHCSLEPGFVARQLLTLPDVDVQWFGKPHQNVYELALGHLRREMPELSKKRVLMVGDSPHTDILGARHCGLDSCMTVDFGLLRDQPLRARLTEAGIWPNYLMTTARW